MSERRTTRGSGKRLENRESDSDWKRVRKLSERQIEAAAAADADAPLTDAEFWKKARVVFPASRKKLISLRIDEDVVDWFRKTGKGYQSRMNAVLRSYVDAYREER